jgi:chemotaxis protein MotB
MRLLIGAIGLTVAGSLVGCVPAEQYAGMKMKADQLAAQVASDQTAINTADAERDAARNQLQNYNNSDGAKTALLNNQASQISELTKQNEDYNDRYRKAMDTMSKMGTSTALPTGLSNELSDFAAKNPTLIDFDPSRGVVKFKSDVTFAAGDATVSAAAKPVLTTFATILNSPGTEGYELLVAGHTDSTPVTNKRTIEKGNFDNWYLSSHRAIAVSKELMFDGVSAKRLGVIGYADQRPIPGASNAQNRRVEVLILPTTARSSAGYAGVTPTKTHHARTTIAPEAVPARDVMTKDGGSVPPAPAPAPVMTQ